MIKMKSKFFAVVSAFSFLFASLAFVACSKDDVNTPEHTPGIMTEKSIVIPRYSDWEEVNSIISSAYSFDTITDLISFEEWKGLQSIGRLSDFFYEGVDYSDFETEKSAIEFYSQHQDMLDTIWHDGDLEICPKWFYSPFRYVANKQGYFEVGNYVCRLFKNCMVSTLKDNLEELTLLDEQDLTTLDSTVFFCSKIHQSRMVHQGCAPSWVYENTLSTNADRVCLKLLTYAACPDHSNYFYETRVQVCSHHRFVGIWWVSKHTLTCQGSVSIHAKNGTGEDDWETITRDINIVRKCFSINQLLCARGCLYGISPNNYHYSSFNLSASTPSLASATLSYN